MTHVLHAMRGRVTTSRPTTRSLHTTSRPAGAQ